MAKHQAVKTGLPTKVVLVLLAGTALSIGLGARAQEGGGGNARVAPSVYVERNYVQTPKRIVYTAARSLGMLRGLAEQDLFLRLRYHGKGTVWTPTKGGPWASVPVSNYYVEISYAQDAMRVDESTPSGRVVRVVTGDQAWDEAGLAKDGPPVGSSRTPAPAALKARLDYLALTPYGAIKATHANIDKVKMTALPHGVYVLSFPYNGGTMKVTLDRNRRPSRVEIPFDHPVVGRTTLVAEYSGYKDYEPLSPTSDEPWSFAYFPSRIVHRLGDRTTLDVNVDTCWCTNPYVTFAGRTTRKTTIPDAPDSATPRGTDGHPDLAGMWTRVVAEAGVVGRAFIIGRPEANDSGGAETNTQVRQGNNNYEEVDAEYIVKSDQDMPAYKPEFWERVRDLEENAYRRPADPQYGCKNQGLVRLGPPAEVFQTPVKVAFLYTPNMAIPWFREISLDGRPLPSPDGYAGVLPAGVSAGRWEGDTLIVESVDFPTDEGVWYGTRGWVGSPDTKITERYHRAGDRMTYDITVDDPAFTEPWTRPTVTLAVNKTGMLAQPLTCIEYDGGYLPPSN